MFYYIIGGPLDPNSASIALGIMFITLCIVLTTIISKRRSSKELNIQFELEKIKLHNQDQADKRQNDRQLSAAMAKYAMDKDISIRRIETGLIEQ